MFAPLDPTSRRLRFPREREVIIADTVGVQPRVCGEAAVSPLGAPGAAVHLLRACGGTLHPHANDLGLQGPSSARAGEPLEPADTKNGRPAPGTDRILPLDRSTAENTLASRASALAHSEHLAHTPFT